MRLVSGMFYLSLLLGMSVAAFAVASSQGDVPAVHGMLLVGNRTLYVSHLPMFHAPHDYQVILEVSLSAPGINPQDAYVTDRLKTHEKIYTVEPDQAFILPAVVGQKASFPATIFRGHFERGGIPILKGVTVSIRKVVYFHKFNPVDPPLGRLSYLLFGNRDELFVAHLIMKCPDYDQVAAAASAHFIDFPMHSSSLLLSIPVRSNSQPLKEGEVIRAMIGSGPTFETFKVLGQFYFETGDLACMTLASNHTP